MKLNKREKRLLSLLIALLIFACYYFFVYSPMIGDIEVMTLEMDTMTAQLGTSQAKEKQLPALRGQVNSLAQKIESTCGQIPEIVGEQELVVRLYKIIKPLARKTSLIIEHPTAESQYSSIIFNISLETSYQNFKRILELLEASKYNNVVSFVINGKSLARGAGDTGLDRDTGDTGLDLDAEDISLYRGKNYNITVNMSIEFYYILQRDGEIEGYPYIKGVLGSRDPFRGN